MNEKYRKLLELMAAYDACAVGSPERAGLGLKIDREGGKISERDFWRIAAEYEKAQGFAKEAAR